MALLRGCVAAWLRFWKRSRGAGGVMAARAAGGALGRAKPRKSCLAAACDKHRATQSAAGTGWPRERRAAQLASRAERARSSEKDAEEFSEVSPELLRTQARVLRSPSMHGNTARCGKGELLRSSPQTSEKLAGVASEILRRAWGVRRPKVPASKPVALPQSQPLPGRRPLPTMKLNEAPSRKEVRWPPLGFASQTRGGPAKQRPKNKAKRANARILQNPHFLSEPAGAS